MNPKIIITWINGKQVTTCVHSSTGSPCKNEGEKGFVCAVYAGNPKLPKFFRS